MQLLFYTRLVLYLLAASIPVVHPGVAVPYDTTGWWLWFGIVPLEAFICFYLSPPRLRVRTWLAIAAAPVLLAVLVLSGLNLSAFRIVGAAALAFGLTALVFKTGGRGYPVAMAELFVLGYLFYKLLSFTRASESVARQSGGLTQVLLVVVIAGFLLHAMVLYLAAFHQGNRKRGLRQLGIFAAGAIPALLILAVVLPPDFVTHNMVSNVLRPEPRPDPVPLNEQGEGFPGGNLQSERDWLSQRNGRNGQNPGDGQGQGRQPQLQGVPADQWNQGQGQRNGEGTGRGRQRQRAVMVIASSLDPIYAADGYYGRLEGPNGFQLTRNQQLNDLTYMRLLDTWKQSSPARGEERSPEDMFVLSSIQAKVMPYQPLSVEPTVLDRKYHPFSYSYNATSLVSDATRNDFARINGLSQAQLQSMQEYLEVPLPASLKSSFQSYLQSTVGNTQGYYRKALEIFRSFSDYQYEVGFTDNLAISHMEEFLLDTKSGDCTEFSNTAAILTRLAGIPTRVVTGYLATSGLQTPAHMQGLMALQQSIKPLQDYSIRDMYLVTTAHKHSWIQMFMPGYGWVDFDPTNYAIPPQGGANPNSQDVVIPLINAEELQTASQIPWGYILRSIATVIIAGILLLYAFHYGWQAYLAVVARGRDRRAMKALYTLLLIRLSAYGYRLKSRADTAKEYGEDYPELSYFAELYTEMRYRETFRPGEWDELFGELRQEYRRILTEYRPPGILSIVRRLFSLKTLYFRV